MKKGWKIFWIICGSLFSLGIVLTIVGFTLGATWDVVTEEFPDWIGFGKRVPIHLEKEYEYGERANEITAIKTFDGITDIKVEASIINIQFLVEDSSAHELCVEVSDETFADKLDIYQEDEKLVVETNDKWEADDTAGTVWIYLPRVFVKNVKIDIDAGTVYMEMPSVLNKLDVSVGAGEAVIEHFTAGEIELECGAGRLEASGNCEKEVDITCGAGEVELVLADAEEYYNYEVECGIGQVVIGNEAFSGLGRENYYSNNAKKEMSIECGIGTIRVLFERGIGVI